MSNIELSFPDEVEIPTEPYLRRHVTVRRGPQFAQIFAVVYSAFGAFLPDFATDPHLEAERYLAGEVIDLLYALSRGKSMIRILSTKDAAIIAAQLPISLSVPLLNLYSAMHQISPYVVMPKQLIDTESLALFQEILADAAFRRYANAQGYLEEAESATNANLRLISRAAEHLCTKTRRLLKLRRIIATVLPASSSLVDKGFGALPGRLADLAVAAATPWLQDHRQMVIYDLSEPVTKLVRQGGPRSRI